MDGLMGLQLQESRGDDPNYSLYTSANSCVFERSVPFCPKSLLKEKDPVQAFHKSMSKVLC